MNENDAIEKLKAGADLIQVYTGFIYNGPSLIKNINKKILSKLMNNQIAEVLGEIRELRNKLKNHPVYSSLKNG